jgi:hypothetical protein
MTYARGSSEGVSDIAKTTPAEMRPRSETDVQTRALRGCF